MQIETGENNFYKTVSYQGISKIYQYFSMQAIQNCMNGTFIFLKLFCISLQNKFGVYTCSTFQLSYF